MGKVKRLYGLAVATLEEAIALRADGVQGRILVMSGITRWDRSILKLVSSQCLEPVIAQLSALRELTALEAKLKYEFPVHIKVNTGMNRLGIDAIPEAIQLIKKWRRAQAAGLLSHYAAADAPASELTQSQTARFRDISGQFAEAGLKPKLFHLANSAGAHNKCFPEGNLVRIGLHLYGEEHPQLTPILTWKTEIIDVRTVNAGDSVGYGPSYVANGTRRIAILACGYADGYPRLLSNRSEVLIQGKRCRVTGTISMDLLAVDVSEVPQARRGMTAILLGKDRSNRITALELSEHANTIPWEILTGISPRVPRVYRK